MTVTQFACHVAEKLEQLRSRHTVIDIGGIAGVHVIPIYTEALFLLVEETIAFVHYPPQRFHVVGSGVVVLIYIHT